MTDNCKYIIDFLNCEYELFENEKDDKRIIEMFNKWTKEGRQNGYYPVIVVPDPVLSEALELAMEDVGLGDTQEEIRKNRDDIIRSSKEIDVKEFLDEKYAEYSEMHEDTDIIGNFKETEPTNWFYSHLAGSGSTPQKEILLAKIPVRNPWEIAAWIPMGGFNDCPDPAVQTAVFHYWYEKYGAVPALVTYDNWEMELTNPPKTDEEAEELAKEQFAFCYDLVMQSAIGWDKIRALASTLKNSSTWYFWWD